MERWEGKKEVSAEEKEAWQNIAKEIILINPSSIELSEENVGQISEEIQRGFLELWDKDQSKMRASITEGLDRLGKELGLELRHGEQEQPRPSSDSPLYFRHAMAINNRAAGYFGWGFSPKLALQDGSLRPNCLGQAILLGSYAKRSGVDVQMAITPDHPYIVAKSEGKRYLIDTGRELEIDESNIEKKDGYEIYRIKNGDRERMIFICDFNEAVLNETLENIAVLNRLGNEPEQYTLPGSREEGEKIAKEHRESLSQADWQIIQAKLCPTISKAFVENKSEWSNEVVSTKEMREKQYSARIINTAFVNATKNLGIEEKKIKGVYKKIISDSKERGEQIMNFVKNKIPLTDDSGPNLKTFWTFAVKEFESLDDSTRERVLEILNKNFSSIDTV